MGGDACIHDPRRNALSRTLPVRLHHPRKVRSICVYTLNVGLYRLSNFLLNNLINSIKYRLRYLGIG